MINYKGRVIPQTLKEIIDPKYTALIVHEMLNDFLKPGGVGTSDTETIVDVSSIIPTIANLIKVARKKNVRIVYVRFTKYEDYHTWNDPMISKSYKKIINPKTPVSTVDGTWGHQIIDELAPQEGDIIVNKFRTDSFFQTNLDMMLRSNGIKTFIMVGFGAEAGQVPSITHGVNIGYFAVSPTDCIHPTDISWHDDALRMLSDWSIMTTSTEIIESWGA